MVCLARGCLFSRSQHRLVSEYQVTILNRKGQNATRSHKCPRFLHHRLDLLSVLCGDVGWVDFTLFLVFFFYFLGFFLLFFYFLGFQIFFSCFLYSFLFLAFWIFFYFFEFFLDFLFLDFGFSIFFGFWVFYFFGFWIFYFWVLVFLSFLYLTREAKFHTKLGKGDS